MTKEEMTDIIIAEKKAKGLTWEAIASKLGMGQTWVTSACLGMNSMPEESAKGLSAIDFSMDIDKLEDPKGDRVVITLNGKFLRYSSW